MCFFSGTEVNFYNVILLYIHFHFSVNKIRCSILYPMATAMVSQLNKKSKCSNLNIDQRINPLSFSCHSPSLYCLPHPSLSAPPPSLRLPPPFPILPFSLFSFLLLLLSSSPVFSLLLHSSFASSCFLPRFLHLLLSFFLLFLSHFLLSFRSKFK